MQKTNVPPSSFKRLCVFSDGTTMSSESETSSNIYRLSLLIPRVSPTGIPQTIFYDPGVGTGSSPISNLLGSAFGDGLDQNIKQMYAFLVEHYNPGDHILLFGYSRGAYSVRSLAGLIYRLGLLKPQYVNKIDLLYDMYRAEIPPDSPRAQNFRRTHGDRVPIKLIACFDSVGALGVSERSPWPISELATPESFRFHDIDLNDHVEHAIHALSIDEQFFIPTLMHPSPSHNHRHSQLTQKYLPGSHAGVGGGSADEVQLSDNALRFVVDEIVRRGIGLQFDMDRVPKPDIALELTIGPPSVPEQLLTAVSGAYIRQIQGVEELHSTAILRYGLQPEWRPLALAAFEEEILSKYTTVGVE